MAHVRANRMNDGDGCERLSKHIVGGMVVGKWVEDFMNRQKNKKPNDNTPKT